MDRLGSFDIDTGQVTVGQAAFDAMQNAVPGVTQGHTAAVEHVKHTMEEIVHCIEQAGLTPDQLDLTQLWQAIRFAANPWITSDVTYAINAAGDGDFADINDAMAFLATRLIAEGATVTLQLDAGVHTYAAGILIRHVHGHRIHVRGAPLTGADPVLADFATTGHSVAARAADAAANLAMLQTKFATEIHLTGGAQVRVEDCGLGLLDDVFIRGDGTVAYGVVLRNADKVVVGTVSVHGFGDDNVYARASTIQLVGTLTASGGAQDGIELNNSRLFFDGENSAAALGGLVVAVGNGSAGVDLAASEVTISEAACHCNASDGLFGALASSCFLRRADIDSNGGHGVRFTNGGSATFSTGPSVLSNNGEAGVFAGHCSAVDIGPATWSGNGTFGGVARGGAFIDGTAETGGNGGASGWSSPTSNTVGNLNAFVAF